MGQVHPDVYHTNDVAPLHHVGYITDGPPDAVYGMPTKFMYARHRNAVTVVAGHKAEWVVLGSEVTNDVDGSAPGLGIVAGAYVNVPTADYYCFIQIGGYNATLLGDGSVAHGEGIAYDAADGVWDTITTGEENCGQCVLDDTGSPATFPGFLNCPFKGGS